MKQYDHILKERNGKPLGKKVLQLQCFRKAGELACSVIITQMPACLPSLSEFFSSTIFFACMEIEREGGRLGTLFGEPISFHLGKSPQYAEASTCLKLEKEQSVAMCKRPGSKESRINTEMLGNH